MPMSRDEYGGGTEADGSLSEEYCHRCYEGGSFSEPQITAPEMVERARKILLRSNADPAQVERITRGIPELRRWARARLDAQRRAP